VYNNPIKCIKNLITLLLHIVTGSTRSSLLEEEAEWAWSGRP